MTTRKPSVNDATKQTMKEVVTAGNIWSVRAGKPEPIQVIVNIICLKVH